MKIVFLGAGDIGLPTLRYLLAHPRHQVVAVVTQPDKPVGRRQTLTPPQVKVLAQAAGLPVFQPDRIKNVVEDLRKLDADVFIVIAYGQILPQTVLDLPKFACLNLHASLLPKYRGASPIQAALLAGETETGMTVMYVAAGLDSGDVLRMERIPIAADETGGFLHDKLADLGPIALGPALDLLESGAAPRTPQDHAAATLCKKLGREDGIIDWTLPAEHIARQIRAFHPWPGAATTFLTPEGARTLKLFPPVFFTQSSEGGIPGQVLVCDPQFIRIACGNGALQITELQLEGRKRLPVREFVMGARLEPGQVLGAT